jgi:hypothetical protein
MNVERPMNASTTKCASTVQVAIHARVREASDHQNLIHPVLVSKCFSDINKDFKNTILYDLTQQFQF